MGKVFHPVAYKGKKDDIAGGSWTAPYFQPGRGEDNAFKLSETNCGVAAPVEDESQYTDGMTANHAVEVLTNNSKTRDATGQPFFVAVGFHRPHLPWVVPSKYFDLYDPKSISLADHNTMPKDYNSTGAQPWSWDPQSGPRHCQPLYNMSYVPSGSPPQLPEYGLVPDKDALHFRRSYYAAVSFMDGRFGLVLDTLEQLGRDKDTIVAFVGDHGWQLGDLGEFGKKTNFERATRTPFIIRNPMMKANAAGTRSNALVEFVDIMPTLIDLALGAPPPLCPADSSAVALCTEGRSLKKVMASPTTTADLYPAAFMQYATCMHDDRLWHDGCGNSTEPHVMGYAMRTRQYRYIEWIHFDKTVSPSAQWQLPVLGTEMYDHTTADSVKNAAEAVNLAGDPAHEATRMELSKQLRAGWRAGLALN